MNQIMDNIKSRRSKRYFIDKNIPDRTIREIIEAGCYAPSALNRQPWKFIVITNRDCIKRLSSIVKKISSKVAKYLPLLRLINSSLKDPQVVGAIKKTISSDLDTIFHNAPLLILITSAKSEPYAAKDCLLASQNMMLYANSIGIGSCFIGRAEILMRSREAKDIIGLPPHHTIQAAIVFGYTPHNKETPDTLHRQSANIINWVS